MQGQQHWDWICDFFVPLQSYIFKNRKVNLTLINQQAGDKHAKQDKGKEKTTGETCQQQGI